LPSFLAAKGLAVNQVFLRRARWVLGLALVLACGWSAATADEPAVKTKTRFLRIERDADGEPLALETAIVRYESDAPEYKGVTIDLIGAVHVGEKAYYEKLNKEFEGYDAVLYEMVAPEGTRIPKGAKPGGMLATLQNGMKDLLGLEHQLQYIDYTKPNLVHADMSPMEFAKSMADRGETMTDLLLRMMVAGLNKSSSGNAGKSSELEMLMALFDPNRAGRLKRMVAEQFADLETLIAGIDGPNGSTILTERNKVALGKLEKQLDSGRKHVAIFYGVGHLPDMSQRLTGDWKFHQVDQRWLTAWKLTDEPAPAKGAEKAKPAAAAP
jgi:hypothetical protein